MCQVMRRHDATTIAVKEIVIVYKTVRFPGTLQDVNTYKLVCSDSLWYFKLHAITYIL